MLIVQKYGGSSLADKNRLFNAALRIAKTYDEGSELVVVVSAMGKMTDELINEAYNINAEPSMRELDMILSTGEQQSAALMAMALNKIGYNAISLSAWQLGIAASDSYGSAKITAIDTGRIRDELSKGKIVIAAGFQGINRFGDITTLGRGGSDTTAVALAEALKADKCEIYTDVDGVFTADPRVVDNAEMLTSISYDEMLDYTTMGAKVLHNRSVELAKLYKVPVSVRSSFSDNDGTTVCAEKSERLISGIVSDEKTAVITVNGTGTDKAHMIFSAVAENNINVDIIMSSPENGGKILFTVNSADAEKAARALKKGLGCEAEVSYDFAKISIIGAGLEANSGIAAKVFDALKNAGIDIRLITTSEIKISVLVRKDDSIVAVRELHNKLIEKSRL